MLVARTVDTVSAVLEQPEQTKMCTIVTSSTSDERVQFISVAQFGQ